MEPHSLQVHMCAFQNQGNDLNFQIAIDKILEDIKNVAICKDDIPIFYLNAINLLGMYLK